MAFNNKVLMVGATALTLAGLTVAGTGIASADDQAGTSVDANRQVHAAKHQQRLESRLSQAVTDGKITSEQKDKILAKLTELRSQMQSNRASMQGKTPSERRAAKDARRAELKKWASDNGIPEEYILIGPGGRGHGRPAAAPSGTSSTSPAA
jgi:3-hydroxyacyl-CoA dehydrogenase